jgi:hypothetical protein
VAPIPVGNLSCSLTRASKRPTVLTGDCTGPGADPFTAELTLDR